MWYKRRNHVDNVDSDEKKDEDSEITPRRLKQRWTSYLYQKVQMIEEAAWLRQMEKKPKLRTYCKFKHKLELESSEVRDTEVSQIPPNTYPYGDE